MSRSHLVEVNISIVPTDSRWDGNTDRPKSLSKATLKKRFVNNYSQNVFFFFDIYYVMLTDASKQREQEAGVFSVCHSESFPLSLPANFTEEPSKP